MDSSEDAPAEEASAWDPSAGRAAVGACGWVLASLVVCGYFDLGPPFAVAIVISGLCLGLLARGPRRITLTGTEVIVKKFKRQELFDLKRASEVMYNTAFDGARDYFTVRLIDDEYLSFSLSGANARTLAKAIIRATLTTPAGHKICDSNTKAFLEGDS